MKLRTISLVFLFLALVTPLVFGQDESYLQLKQQLKGKTADAKIQILKSFLDEHVDRTVPRLMAMDRLCSQLAFVGENAEAAIWIEKGKHLARELDKDFILMKMFQMESAVRCEMSEFERGVQAATTSINMAEGSKWKSFAVMPLIERGINLANLNEYQRAVEDFHRALEIAESKNRDDWKMRVQTNLASVYGMMKQLGDEAETLQSALVLANKLDHQAAIASLTVNWANNLLTREQLEEAETRFSEAFEIAKRLGMRNIQAIALTGKADIAAMRKDYESAKAHFVEAKQIYQAASDQLGVVQIQARLGAVDSALTRINVDTQVTDLNRLVTEAVEIGNRELVISLLDQLISIHRSNREWESMANILLRRQQVEREIWFKESQQAGRQLIAKRQELTQQKNTANALFVVCTVLVLLVAVATVLWRIVRLSANRLQADKAMLLRNEKAKIEHERELAQRQKSESITMMSAGIIHDFNNFLSAIVSSAELGKLLPGTAKKDELFDSILNTGLSASELTRNLSDFIGQGKMDDSVCELTSILDQENELWSRLVENHIVLKLKLPEHPVWVGFDAVEIKQIVTNLIKNSADALRDRSGKIEIVVESGNRETGSADKTCQLVVRDNGCGMTEDDVSRATEPFYSSKGVGRGLGLASVKGIVERNQGTIGIYSNPAAGCEVVITMKQISTENDYGSKPVEPSGVFPNELEFRKILLVEDDVKILERVKSYLVLQGVDVIATEKVTTAIEILESETDVDCVITDYLLADQSGRFLAKNVRSVAPNMPILLLSGYAEQDVFESDLFDEYMSKPFRLNELMQTLYQMSNKHNRKRGHSTSRLDS